MLLSLFAEVWEVAKIALCDFVKLYDIPLHPLFLVEVQVL